MPSPNLIRLSQLPVADALTGLERLPILQYGTASSARVEQILGSPDDAALDLETPFYEPPSGGRILLRADRTVHLVSAAGGAVEAVLPLAREVPRRVAVIKKLDDSANTVTVTAEEQTVYLAPRPVAAGGKVALDGTGSDPAPIAPLDPPAVPDPDPTIAGLDGQAHVLAARYDFVMAISNGAEWQIIAGGWQGAQDDHLDLETVAYAPESGGVIALATDRSVHLVDATGGATEAHLPAPADVPRRVMAVKKTDASVNAVTVTTAGGGGPDGAALVLDGEHHHVAAISDGSAWHMLAGGWQSVLADVPFSGDYADLTNAPDLSQDADLTAIAEAAGYGILEKNSATEGDWGFRGLGTGAADHLLRRSDGDGRYVEASAIATVALTGDYDDLINKPGVGTGWVNPSGSGYNKGNFDADEVTNVGFSYDRDEVNEINFRLQSTRAVLRALILELKTIGIFSS